MHTAPGMSSKKRWVNQHICTPSQVLKPDELSQSDEKKVISFRQLYSYYDTGTNSYCGSSYEEYPIVKNTRYLVPGTWYLVVILMPGAVKLLALYTAARLVTPTLELCWLPSRGPERVHRIGDTVERASSVALSLHTIQGALSWYN